MASELQKQNASVVDDIRGLVQEVPSWESRNFGAVPPPVTGVTPAEDLNSFANSASSFRASSAPLIPQFSKVETSSLQDNQSDPSSYSDQEEPFQPGPQRRRWILPSLAALVFIILAVILGAYFGVTRHRHSNKATGKSESPKGSPPVGSSPSAVFGKDGTVVTTEDGTKFVYNNSFGGYFVQDPGNPFNNAARPQSWTPPLNQSWTWGKDLVYG
jgi:hypothetical protein